MQSQAYGVRLACRFNDAGRIAARAAGCWRPGDVALRAGWRTIPRRAVAGADTKWRRTAAELRAAAGRRAAPRRDAHQAIAWLGGAGSGCLRATRTGDASNADARRRGGGLRRVPAAAQPAHAVRSRARTAAA